MTLIINELEVIYWNPHLNEDAKRDVDLNQEIVFPDITKSASFQVVLHEGKDHEMKGNLQLVGKNLEVEFKEKYDAEFDGVWHLKRVN